MLTVSEFGRIRLSDRGEALPNGDLLLTKKHFRSLMSLLENEEDESPEYSPVFTYRRPKGEEQLWVQNYIGVIRLADGEQIEVLPKISKNLDHDSARDILIKMLVELEDSKFFEGTAAALEAHDMPLFELILRCYLEQVTTIVKKGIARDYVSNQDNLVYPL